MFRLVTVLLFSIVLGCASPTHKIDPYPGETQPQHNTQAYQAKNGGLSPATESDATISAGLATIGAVVAAKNKASPVRTAEDAIHIECQVVNGLAQIPCSSVFLILKTESGEVFSHGRTDTNGELSFLVNRGHKYLLEVKGTQFAMSMSPAGTLQAGSKVRVRLQARNP